MDWHFIAQWLVMWAGTLVLVSGFGWFYWSVGRSVGYDKGYEDARAGKGMALRESDKGRGFWQWSKT